MYKSQALWQLITLPVVHGILHWTGAGETSWHGFASDIHRQGLELDILEREIPILPVPTSAYPTPAKLPAYSLLDKTSTWAALDLQSEPWETVLERVLRAKV